MRFGLILLLFSSCLFAQDQPQGAAPSQTKAQATPKPAGDYLFDFGDQAISVTGAFSPASNKAIGVSLDRKFFKANLDYSWVLASNRQLALRYILGIVPAAIVTQPSEIDFKHSVPGNTVVRSARTTYGFGADPLGLRLNFGSRKLQPFVDTHAGLLYFTEDVPVPDSSQINFTFSFGGGFELFRQSRDSWTLGYRYHHTSNDEIGVRNPGIDSQMFYLSYTWARRSK